MPLDALSKADINIPGGIDFALPRMAPVRQMFERHTIEDVAGAGGGAALALKPSTDDCQIAADRYRIAELVARGFVQGDQLGQLTPTGRATEHICGARIQTAIIIKRSTNDCPTGAGR